MKKQTTHSLRSQTKKSTDQRTSTFIGRLTRSATLMALALALGLSSFILTISFSAQAQDTTSLSGQSFDAKQERVDKALIDKLLAMELKPTIQDMLAQFKGRRPPKREFHCLYYDERIYLTTQIAPEMIAQLEAAYPGATWAVLGRDAALFGDILEAYYLTHGQKDRVVRLNASTASFNLEKQELAFLAAAGLVDKKGRVKKKFVLLDPTSWNRDSQVQKILASVYAVNDDPLLPRIANAVGLGTSHRGQQGEFMNPQLDIEAFRRDTQLLPTPSRILYVDGRLSYLQPYKGLPEIAWHDSFSPFKLDLFGRPVAPPGQTSSVEHRRHILWMMERVITIVQSEEFQKQVEDIARSQYGYDFQANAIRGEFAYLENDEKLNSFLKQREWTESSIQAWLQETRTAAAPGYRDLIEWRLMDVINEGLENGTLTLQQGANLLKDLIPRLDGSSDGLKLSARLLKRVSSSPRPNIWNALLKYNCADQVPLWWDFAIQLQSSGTGLARQFMATRPYDLHEVEETFASLRPSWRPERARQLLSAAFQWAPDQASLTALVFRMEHDYNLRASSLWTEAAPILVEMKKQREAKPSFWRRASKKISNACAGALRMSKN